MSVLYDKSATYVNIIMAVGYAGFFAVWSNMKVYMSTFDMRISALCMLTSIILFAMWEVTKMIITSHKLHGMQEVINASPAEFNAKLAAQQHGAAILHVQVMKWWPIVLFLTIVTALVATSILIYSFIINLLV
ncbi:MAG: hypothetical protein H0U72_05295 [Nitrosospira sp.]|nr:hypothetical protein [Nitrosospira sp.]